MGKKPKRETRADASASAAKVVEPVEAKERRFRWWQLIVGAVVALAVVLIPLLWNEFKSTPQFALAKPITRPDSGIVIVAQNRAASRKAPLTIEFDGFKFADAGQMIPASEPLAWHFNLQDFSLPDSLLRDGAHRVRIGFAGDQLSEPLFLAFSTQAPVVEAEIIQPLGKPQDRVIKGKAATNLQTPAETLAVDVVFHHEGYPQRISVPVKRDTIQATGLIYFEFETTIQGLPIIPQNDPRYSEPFFAFQVTDQAGNRYHQQESYAQFMAPGNKQFGVNSLADIEVKRLPVDLRGRTKVEFRVVPKLITQLSDGQPPIFLRVKSLALNVKQLEWTVNLPVDLRLIQPQTIILRDERPVGSSFENQYRDDQAPASREANYRVEQTGRDGLVYSSNTAKAPRSEPPEDSTQRRRIDTTAVAQIKESPVTDSESTLSVVESRVNENAPVSDYLSVKAIREIISNNYRIYSIFDSGLQPSGTQFLGTGNVFEQNGVKLVNGGLTELIWQQSGSSKPMTYETAQQYVMQLNKEKYGGYDDWRLPTLLEALALLQPKKVNQLHLNREFDRQQLVIWTVDKSSADSAWVVDFAYGGCVRNNASKTYYVRAVRGSLADPLWLQMNSPPP